MKNKRNVTIETESLMTIKDAAELVGVSRMTLYRWINAGKVMTITFGNINYVMRVDVERIKEVREG